MRNRCGIRLLIQLLTVGILSCSTVAAGTADAVAKASAAVEVLAVLDATNDRGERLRLPNSTLANAIVCSATLGANGELITLGAQNPNAPERSYSYLGIVPDDPGYRVVLLAFDCTALGLSFGDTYATIHADGTFKLAVGQELHRLLPLSPDRWPTRSGEPGLFFPDYGTVIARGSVSASRNEATPRADALGWCLLDWDGYLISPRDDFERPENFLWIVRTTDGIQFVHSGPLRTGIYATITGDRRVLYGVGAPDSLRNKTSPDWWPYVKDDVIVPIPKGRLGRPGPKYLFAAWDGDTLVGLQGGPPIE